MSDSGRALPPLRACLLSGGASRRMGQDKALLPHPEGGCWLERSLTLLAGLELPISLLSRHPRHLELARQWQETRTQAWQGREIATTQALGRQPEPVAGHSDPAQARWFEVLEEPPPREGPLLALQRLMQAHPDQRLLLCPVDMPWLTLEVLQRLVAASDADPMAIQLAEDGERLQPLLGIYPSQARRRLALAEATANGERRLQTWLAGQPCRAVRFDPRTLRNVNWPEEWLPNRSASTA